VAIGVSLIAYSLYTLLHSFSEFATLETAHDFLLSPLLTLAYLPFIFFMVIYTAYKRVFLCLSYSVKNTWTLRFTRIFSLIMFNVRIKELERWISILQSHNIKTIRDVFKTWEDFRCVRKIEKKPPVISKNDGWSPYKAQNFLNSYDIKTGYYKELEDSWFASSSDLEFGDEINPSNIAYYIDGNDRAVQSLKVVINVNDSKDSDAARVKMLGISETLYQHAVGEDLPIEFQKAICIEESRKIEYPQLKVFFEKRIWSEHRLNGYSLIFCISNLRT